MFCVHVDTGARSREDTDTERPWEFTETLGSLDIPWLWELVSLKKFHLKQKDRRVLADKSYNSLNK